MSRREDCIVHEINNNKYRSSKVAVQNYITNKVSCEMSEWDYINQGDSDYKDLKNWKCLTK